MTGWQAVEPFTKTSTTAGITLEPLRAYKQASADKAKESRQGRAEAHHKGVIEGEAAERQRQEAAAKPTAPAPSTIVVQPATPPPSKAPDATDATAPKTRVRGKRG